MHTGRKNPSWHRFEPCKLKKIRNFFCLFFSFLLFSYIWLVYVCLISLSTFFQPNNYGQLSGNSAFGQVALKWFSNTWCKLLFCSYGVCASHNNSDKTVHMQRRIIFTVYLFNEWQLYTSWFNSFSFLVYKMWCTVIMHIQN